MLTSRVFNSLSTDRNEMVPFYENNVTLYLLPDTSIDVGNHLHSYYISDDPVCEHDLDTVTLHFSDWQGGIKRFDGSPFPDRFDDFVLILSTLLSLSE